MLPVSLIMRGWGCPPAGSVVLSSGLITSSCKRRNEIERLFCRLKAYRRIFPRYDKLDVIFLAFITLALIYDTLNHPDGTWDIPRSAERIVPEWRGFTHDFRLREELLRLLRLYQGLRSTYRGSDVTRRVRRFDGWTDRSSASDAGPKGNEHAETVREYYDLFSELMVFGWSESLHFAPLSPRESLEESQIRHQRLMIRKLELREGMTVVDVGCGVGGPMRRVVREAGVRVVGVNHSDVQLAKARSLNTEAGLDHMVDYLATSFMDMGAIADGMHDRAYAIESTCHAPDKVGAFAEIYRVLKPGSLFWGQEMCMTDRFDPGNSEHLAIKADLQHGIALKDIATTDEVDRALAAAGFEVAEGIDRAVGGTGPSKPWYQPMATRIRMGNLKAHIGAAGLAEAVRVLPKGTTDAIRVLDRTAAAYVAGGRTGIFTPLYCFLARKPLEGK